jgi:hypothetical protein
MPVFLYDDYVYNPEDPEEGLFQGPFLVCVSTYPPIYRCVSTPMESIGSYRHLVRLKRGGYKGRQTSRAVPTSLHRGNVQPYKHFTTEYRICGGSGMSLKLYRAFALTILKARFCLSSRRIWSFKDDCFDYSVFYKAIMMRLEDDEDPWVQLTLAWWNE